jgi:hypothetical protein
MDLDKIQNWNFIVQPDKNHSLEAFVCMCRGAPLEYAGSHSQQLRPITSYAIQQVDTYCLSQRGRFTVLGRSHHDFPSLLKWTLQFRVRPSSCVKTDRFHDRFHGRFHRLSPEGTNGSTILRPKFGAGRPYLIREGDGTVYFSPCNVGAASIRPYRALLTAWVAAATTHIR